MQFRFKTGKQIYFKWPSINHMNEKMPHKKQAHKQLQRWLEKYIAVACIRSLHISTTCQTVKNYKYLTLQAEEKNSRESKTELKGNREKKTHKEEKLAQIPPQPQLWRNRKQTLVIHFGNNSRAEWWLNWATNASSTLHSYYARRWLWHNPWSMMHDACGLL